MVLFLSVLFSGDVAVILASHLNLSYDNASRLSDFLSAILDICVSEPFPSISHVRTTQPLQAALHVDNQSPKENLIIYEIHTIFSEARGSSFGSCLLRNARESAFSSAQMSSAAMRRTALHNSAAKAYHQEVALNFAKSRKRNLPKHSASVFLFWR